jgi:hypothetical protein
MRAVHPTGWQGAGMASGIARIVLAGFAFLPPAVWTAFDGAAVVFMLAFRFLAIARDAVVRGRNSGTLITGLTAGASVMFGGRVMARCVLVSRRSSWLHVKVHRERDE